MNRTRDAGGTGRTALQLHWSDPNLPPDQFLYQRLGPWPQPAPAYPMSQAAEVLNIPPIEAMVWNEAIGARYLRTQLTYGSTAADKAVKDLAQPVPSDAEFIRVMTLSVYARFLRQESKNPEYWVSDFTAMELVAPETLPGTFCAPVICRFRKEGPAFYCVNIKFLKTAAPSADELTVAPGDKAWNLAKVYALQGAAYHALFVVHPALHFPMDSVNAITKTAVPHTHPLFQALYPHTTYTLALDNAVQEGPNTVVNNNAPGTWFDPLTAGGYVVKQLFGVGYAGYKALPAYPPYDYTKAWMDPATPYGQCLQLYMAPFVAFCRQVASAIPMPDPYVERWGDYCSTYVRGFPPGKLLQDPSTLAKVMAIYLWDVTVSHGADHYSFAKDIPSAHKFLRIRRPRPTSIDDGADVRQVSDVASADDLVRSEMAEEMFFSSWTLPPNLIGTDYAFTDPALRDAIAKFHDQLKLVASTVQEMMPTFMPLGADVSPLDPNYRWTIPATIQY